MIRRLLAAAALVAVFLVVTVPAPVAAMPVQVRQFAVCGGSFANFLGLEPWYECVVGRDIPAKDGNPECKSGTTEVRICGLNDIWLIALTILEDAIKLGVYIATGFVIWGGFKYLKSQGDASQISQAKDVIRNAMIGMVITLLGVTIVQFIVGNIK